MLLAVECSTARGSVAIFQGKDCLSYREYPMRMVGGVDVGTMITAVLSDIGGSDAITQCVTGVGPGSFSGIRSVLGYLQGFCAPRELTLIGIPSAAVCARAIVAETSLPPTKIFSDGGKNAAATFSIIGDARRGHYWIADYRWDGTRLHEAKPLRLISATPFSLSAFQSFSLCSPEPERIQAEGVFHVIPTAREVGLLALESPVLSCAPLPLYLHPAV